jgi:hypothetical protein
MRSLDWKVHEALGTDLTGFTWNVGFAHSVYRETETGVKWIDIPKYSDSAEGLEIMLTELRKLYRVGFRFDMSFDDENYFVHVSTTQDPHVIIGTAEATNLAHACCVAFLHVKERELHDISADGENLEG